MEKSKVKVLIVEDDLVDQMAFKRLVKSENLFYAYAIAGSISEAKKRLHSERFDVVITDCFLGDGSAFEIFDLVKDTPIIFVTGGGDEETAIKAMKAGAYDYLIKDHDRNYIKILPMTIEHAVRQKKADDRFRMMSHAIMSINDSVFITNTNREILFVNKAFYKTYQYNKDEIIGKSTDVFTVAPSHSRGVTNPLVENRWKDEICHKRKDGSIFPVGLSKSVIKDFDGHEIAVVHVARDITDRKNAEFEKMEMQSQLIQAQKMEAIGILTGGVAHDFNNILTAIRGYADMAIMDVDESSPLLSDLKQIQLSAERASDLTRKLLLFSRKHPMAFKPMNLNHIFEDMKIMLQRLIGEYIVIKHQFDPELWTTMVDQGTIDQLLMNLVVNARDAMPNGGQITITTRNVTLDEAQCKNMYEAKVGLFVCLSVSDNGSGMGKETRQHIFEPFFSTKGPGKGSGLGLSVVYGIVKQHNGWINVYSEPGHGTEFKIYLPAVNLKPEEKSDDVVVTEDLQGNNERILLVEDEHAVREFVKKALTKKGYIAFAAQNSEEALRIFKREEGAFDLVFSDVVLPDKIGIDLVEELRTLKPDLNILLSSGYTNHQTRWPVILEKGYRFLQKPYALVDMFRAVKECMSTANVQLSN